MSMRVIRGPGELIAAIPVLLGFVPHESVVVIGLGPGGELGTVMRADRADLLIGDLAREIHDGVRARLRADRVSRVVIVSFTAEAVPLGCAAADGLAVAIDGTVDRVDMWTCDGQHYRVPGCADPQCCPADGTRVPWEATAAPPASALVATCAEWTAPGAAHLLRADARERRRAARAGDRWWARREQEGWRQRSLDLVLESMGRSDDVLALGRATIAIRDVRVRDGVIVRWLGGGADAVADVLAGRATAKVARVLDGALRDDARLPPAPEDTGDILAWCRSAVAHARNRDRAAVLALEAVAAWWSGDVRTALDSADAALECDPEYTLAGLVADVCAAGLEPAWSRSST
ncbi:DUF4192 family protein [uncultured Demequina sp.]|uniref:DUF4192 family protein n=1 Tax=uncultured Demequina sp. TaxID=693499 RepID=UPI0025CBE26D|nr:DUF4192 family protein [uncultured Demequina sp.]